jgi:hypothetical protein
MKAEEQLLTCDSGFLQQRLLDGDAGNAKIEAQFGALHWAWRTPPAKHRRQQRAFFGFEKPLHET